MSYSNQGEDGTWYLKLVVKTGKPANPNRLHPFEVCGFLLDMSEASGDAKYREAADRAFAYVEKGPIANWNWEGQFEDVPPSKLYQNLSHHPPCSAAMYLLKRYPGDAKRLAQARELLKFTEGPSTRRLPVRRAGSTARSRLPRRWSSWRP